MSTALPGQATGAVGQESSLSNWAGDYVTEMLGKGQALSNMPYSAYTGPLTAGPSQLQNQAFQGIGSLSVPGGGNFTPGAFDAGQWNSQTATQYMNPYLEQAMAPQIAEAQRTAEMQRMQNAGRLTQAGAFGGSRQAIMESELDRNLMQEVGDITGRGYRDAYDRAMQAYQTDAGRSLTAQGMGEDSRQFGARFGLDALTADRQVLQDQLQAGNLQRAIESEGIAADMNQFETERDYPYKQVQFMQSLLQGLPLASQNYEYAQPGAFQQFTSGAGGILGLLNQLYNLGGSNT
jgi:hypothetical protein